MSVIFRWSLLIADMSCPHRQAGATAWDGGEAQPPLRELLESNAIDFAKIGRALVPGCGRVRWPRPKRHDI